VKVEETELPGVLVVEPRVWRDARGFLFESYQAHRYAESGITTPFVQDIHSRSVAGTLRGLHYQLEHPQAKLVRAIRGAVWDVAVDVRRGSPTFGRWVAVELSAENAQQMFIPAGFAHGFCVLDGEAEVEYKCGAYYAPDDQRGVAWNDPTLAIPWPVRSPLMSERDRGLPPLLESRRDLPSYAATSP
jgi:dTDP-4-dehydrorhamnose 3,5-epimerase